MPTRLAPPALTVLAAALALVTASAWAQDGRGRHGRDGGDNGASGAAKRDDAPPAQQQSSNRQREDALSDSVRRIERSTRGQVLSAERVQSDGRDVNRIKFMDDRGRVRVYMDDPQPSRAPRTRDDDN